MTCIKACSNETYGRPQNYVVGIFMIPDTNRIRILLVDSDRETTQSLHRNLDGEYAVRTADCSADLYGSAGSFDPQLVIMDINIPDCDGLDVLAKLKNKFPNLFVIILTASSDINMAVKAMKLGAYEYLTKPANYELLTTVIKKALSIYELKTEVVQLRDRIWRNEVFSSIIGESGNIRQIFDEVTKVMTKDVNVLLLGDSGTGKELIARAIHNGSKRHGGPFVVVNCAAITTELADSLLFGHKKGSFTGAFADHTGFFEQARGGTIFLDEIGDMNIDVQAKVLRVLEDKKVRKLGDNRELTVDFRIISATNRDFKSIISKNEFRNDLYYRLEEYPVRIPPLRERRDDIPLLARHFLNEFCKFYEIPEMSISEKAMEDLLGYGWPGNIRELKNVIQRAAVNSMGEQIESVTVGPAEKPAAKTVAPQDQDQSIRTLDELEGEAVEKAYRAAHNNPERACLMLGISRATLYRKLKKYNIH